MLIPSKHNGFVHCTRLLFKKDTPAPDPRIAEAAMRQIGLAERQYADYQANDRPWLQNITNRQLALQEDSAKRAANLSDYQLASMKRNDDRYWGTAVPFENQLLSDVKRFDSDGYKDQQVLSAKADVQSAFDAAQGESARGLARRGVNPASGMALATRGTTDIAKATALATAANKTRMAADQVGLSTKMQMYGGMKGLAGLGATNAGLATSAMGVGVSAANSLGSAGTGFINANNSALSSAMSGMNSGISGMNSQYSAEVSAANAKATGAGATTGAIITAAAIAY